MMEDPLDFCSNNIKKLAKEAMALSRQSNCKRLKVGAISADPTGVFVLSRTFNVCIDCGREIPGVCIGEHAEASAVRQAEEFYGAFRKILIVTHTPCFECAAKIVESRAYVGVYYIYEYRDKTGMEFLKSANVKVVKIEL